MLLQHVDFFILQIIMKSKLVALSFVFLSLLSFQDEDSGILFFDGEYLEAKSLAKAESKYLFIDFYADWCVPCKQMEKFAFATPEIYNHVNRNFIATKVDVDLFSGMDIADTFNIKVYPTIIILDKKGKEVARATGYKTPDELEAIIKPFKRKH